MSNIHVVNIDTTNINATLTFRQGERFFIMDFIPDQEPCYAVMLHETPPFPGLAHEESKGLAVLIAANDMWSGDGSRRWGWVGADGDTKDMIGNMLIEMKAQPGRWHYMLITDGVGHRSIEHVEKLAGIPLPIASDR